MLSLAPLKTLIATEAPVNLPVDIGQISLGMAVIGWSLWRVVHTPRLPLPRSRVYVALAIIMLGFGPSLFSAKSGGAWLTEFVKWVEMLLLVVVVLDLGQSGRWSWIAAGVVLAAVWQAIIGLYEFRGGSGAPHLWIMNYRFFRAFGTFGQPNPFSAFMGLTLPLACGLAWGYVTLALGRWRARRDEWLFPAVIAVMYGGAGLLLLAGLLASWGRGAWLGFGAAVVVMVSFATRKRWQGLGLVMSGAVLFLVMWMAGLVPAGIEQRLTGTLDEFVGFRDMRGVPVGNENFAIVERLAHWQAALNMASEHPWIGVGLGNYEAVYETYRIPSWPRALGHAHNDYLNLLAETGLVGLTGYLAGWILVVTWTLGALSQPDPVGRGMVLGLLGTWTHLAVHSMVDKLYVNNLFLHIGVMLGLLAVAISRCQEPVRWTKKA